MQIGDETRDWSAFKQAIQATTDHADPPESSEIAGTGPVSESNAKPKQKQRKYCAPLGARLCDKLCFADTLLMLEVPLIILPQEPVEGSDAEESDVVDSNAHAEQY